MSQFSGNRLNLVTILEESRHSLIIIEHDPLLFEDAQGMVEYVSQGLHDSAKEAAVLLYLPGPILSWRIESKMPIEYSTSTRG
jgi:hypothetical protein